MSDNDLFKETDPIDTLNSDPADKNYVDDLVGEGKKFQDTNALAKGKLESDLFIDKLQQETAELRDELSKRLSAEEVARQLADKLNSDNPQKNDTTITQSNTITEERVNQSNSGQENLTVEQVDKLLEDKLANVQQKQSRESNLQTSRQKLTELYGPNYVTVLKKATDTLEVGEEFMIDLSETRPTAFIQLVTSVVPAETNQNFASEIRNQSHEVGNMGHTVPNTGSRTYKVYEKLRKEDPDKYFTPEVQQKMFSDIKELGEEVFYK